MDKSVFVDTSYVLANVFKDDKHHIKALELSKVIASNRINIITTELILIEIADSLTKVKFRNDAVLAIRDLRKIAMVEKVDLDVLSRAWDLFNSRSDKEWSMTDCYSFIVMKKYGIKQALTTDKHFEQAGFEILLK